MNTIYFILIIYFLSKMDVKIRLDVVRVEKTLGKKGWQAWYKPLEVAMLSLVDLAYSRWILLACFFSHPPQKKNYFFIKIKLAKSSNKKKT